MKEAFSGLKILDLSRVISGPFCTSIFADLGAEVLKIEGPGGAGDGFRLDDGVTTNNGWPQIFIGYNRGKKGLTLDLKSKEGKEIFLNLVEQADVVVQNFKPGVMRKLGLDYDSLKKVNPTIIMACISGYGRNSPDEYKACYDIIAQAVAGVMSVTGAPGGPPMRMPFCLGDTITSLFAAIGIMAAVNARRIHGVGQEVEVSMVDSLFAMMDFPLYTYLATGNRPEPFGNAGLGVYPHGVFQASDGHFIMSCYEPTPFQKMCVAINRPEIAEREDFSDIPSRYKNRISLGEIINEWSSQLPLRDVLSILGNAGVAAGPINHVDEFAESEHIAAREMLKEIAHPDGGTLKVHALPVKLSQTPASIKATAPHKGQHSQEVLHEWLGISADTFSALREKSVL